MVEKCSILETVNEMHYVHYVFIKYY